VEKFQLGEYLKRSRESQKLSTRALVKLSQKNGDNKRVTESQINKIENGKTNPSFLTLQKIAAALGLPLVIALDGSNDILDTVTVVSTDDIAESLLHALNRTELVELLLFCLELTDEQVAAVLGVAHSIRGFTKPVKEQKTIQE